MCTFKQKIVKEAGLIASDINQTSPINLMLSRLCNNAIIIVWWIIGQHALHIHTHIYIYMCISYIYIYITYISHIEDSTVEMKMEKISHFVSGSYLSCYWNTLKHVRWMKLSVYF